MEDVSNVKITSMFPLMEFVFPNNLDAFTKVANVPCATIHSNLIQLLKNAELMVALKLAIQGVPNVELLLKLLQEVSVKFLTVSQLKITLALDVLQATILNKGFIV